jgi:hypothetical protein
MSNTVLAVTFGALAAGLTSAINGFRILATKTVYPKRLQTRVRWKPWGQAQLALALFIALETVPRLAGCSAGWVLAISLVAPAPLIASLVLQKRAQVQPTKTI